MLLTLQTVSALKDAAKTTLPLTAFLVCAMWIVRRADRAGLAERLARRLARASGGRAKRLYLLVCGLTAALTAVVSLDGAVILMLPLVLALGRGQKRLLRPLLFGTIAVANAFSLAVPEGNPTNLVIMARLGLSPGQFVAHLLIPSLVATAICVIVVAVAERDALGLEVVLMPETRPARDDDETALPVPWMVLGQIAVLVLACDLFAGGIHARPGGSLLAVVALTLVAGMIACSVNNLPASALLAGLLGAGGLGAYAVMTGLSVGALATPRGSVATVLVRDGAPSSATASYARLWLPAALASSTAAAAALWLIG